MALTGLAFPNVEHIAFVALVAFVGTINPSTGDLGVLVPLEHAMLAHGVADQERTATFARYSLIGALATAAGALGRRHAATCWRWPASTRSSAFKLMFYVYAALGLLAPRSTGCLPHAAVRRDAAARRSGRRAASSTSSRAVQPRFLRRRLRVQSLLALWLFERFDLSLAAASVFFFWSSMLARVLLSGRGVALAARIGLINTMVFTHIPSSILPHRWRRSRPTCRRARRCCWCAPRCRRWTCRRAPPT